MRPLVVDLVGPISPPSEKGHQYILTLVDYTTRYPKAIPLKNVQIETVAEALVDIYSRLGISEEILSDQGSQFISQCMQEVSRLLSIKGLTSSPYHRFVMDSWKGLMVCLKPCLSAYVRKSRSSGIGRSMPCYLPIVRCLKSQLDFPRLSYCTDVLLEVPCIFCVSYGRKR